MGFVSKQGAISGNIDLHSVAHTEETSHSERSLPRPTTRPRADASMDNLFSFPAASLGVAPSSSGGAADAPAQELSSEASPAAQASLAAEEVANVRETSDALGQLHVKVKLLNERVFDVHVESNATVAEFRVKVEEVTAIPATLQRLIYRGKLLKDTALLSSYEIQDGHTVHLVAKPATSESASLAPPRDAPLPRVAEDDERARLNRFIGRSRERLLQNFNEGRSTLAGRPTGAGLNDPGLLRPQSTPTTRIRRPGNGDPTGDAWNLAVLREALGVQSDRIPARPSNRDPVPGEEVRQGREQRQMAENDSPVDTAADMGLPPLTEQQPNLDYLSQGIMTLRTVLSTAPLPQEEPEEETSIGAESVATYQENEVTTPEVSPRTSPRRGRRRFFVGQWLDVKDTVNQWLECTVMDMSEDKVLVHYHGWPTRWDEWIDFDSPRIAAFRTRTLHSQNSIHLSPVPSTRLPNAPRVGDNDMRQIVPQLRDLMEEVLPYVNQLASLCEEEEGTESGEDAERRREELSEMAHLVAPFFDRFGRLLVDSARQLDPFLHPDLRYEERRRRLMRVRSSRQSQTQTAPAEDTAVGVRDLITTANRPPPPEPQNARRSIDVHIHAIVAPSSLSSLASLARLGTAIAGAMGSSSRSTSNALEAQRSTSSNDMEDAFGLPRLRPLQGASGDRSILPDSADQDDEDARYTDTSRTPLLSSFRRSSPRSNGASSSRDRDDSTTWDRSRRPPRSPSTRLNDFLSDDFFGPSFSQDSDDMEDPLTPDGYGATDDSHDDVVQYQEIPSPRDSEGERVESTVEDGLPRIGVIPEVEEAERRERERREQNGNASDDSGGLSSSSTSTASSSYPTFLEVMRRTLSGVRNFGFSSSSDSSHSEETVTTTNTSTTAQRTIRSESDSSSSSSSEDIVGDEAGRSNFARSSFFVQSPTPIFPRQRQASSVSSAEEDLDSVD